MLRLAKMKRLIVAVIGMIFMGLALYLRNMMRVSDSIYFCALKNTDLATGSINPQMELAV